MRVLILALVLSGFICFAPSVYAQDDGASSYVPNRYGVALLAGKAYDPDAIGMLLLQGQVLLDYDRIFWHAAPESLRLKLELNGGLTTDGRLRTLLSVDMLALNYFQQLRFASWIPYAEAGIGLIYTDFQVEDQGSRINFNPQLGVGLEYPLENGHALTLGLRLHHLSNGNLLKDNRGVNSALLQVGYLF
ncbi:Opacity protein [Desulfuromusa kysingii]|uniref:Opacity protein n=1 Tax=Desulfuromusa kysingii TaxID=37625 RepID=A0A1H3VRP0_9BACT|nr:acyloxyacyl hydrolase [Desulfuromusa kysingii]SDZ76778.1 Opacity protein [Desulfuromusa kysingii]